MGCGGSYWYRCVQGCKNGVAVPAGTSGTRKKTDLRGIRSIFFIFLYICYGTGKQNIFCSPGCVQVYATRFPHQTRPAMEYEVL